MWFDKKHLDFKHPIIKDNILGYVLPHAGTQFTNNILTHTLRFQPKKIFNKVLIIFFPSTQNENVITKTKKMFHEEYVLHETLQYVIKHYWKLNTKIKFSGFNVRDSHGIPAYDSNTLLVISADFSHFLDMRNAIALENKAAQAIMFNHLVSHSQEMHKVFDTIDDIRSFHLLFRLLPTANLQWIGRTRSPGIKGVGYLSFLIQPIFKLKKMPNGIFITAYDEEMNTRECLGEWFHSKRPWSKSIEHRLKTRVLRLAKQTSRLTNGAHKHLPIKHYTITYLYKEPSNKKFIRGYHGIRSGAFYLPDVFLEHTHTNGAWIQPSDHTWKKGKFRLTETFRHLSIKAGRHQTRKQPKYTLYRARVKHSKII